MLETALEAFVSMDAGGFITGWNRQAELTFGWSGEEAIGRVLADTIIPPRYRERHLAGLEHFLDTGEGAALGRRLELAGLHRKGHEFPIEITISVLQSGETHAFHAFALAFPAWPMDNAMVVVERLRVATPKGLTCSAGSRRVGRDGVGGRSGGTSGRRALPRQGRGPRPRGGRSRPDALAGH